MPCTSCLYGKWEEDVCAGQCGVFVYLTLLLLLLLLLLQYTRSGTVYAYSRSSAAVVSSTAATSGVGPRVTSLRGQSARRRWRHWQTSPAPRRRRRHRRTRRHPVTSLVHWPLTRCTWLHWIVIWHNEKSYSFTTFTQSVSFSHINFFYRTLSTKVHIMASCNFN